MAISEKKLEIWSHQGAKANSAATYGTISSVLNDPDSPYYARDFRTALQGSYGNDTNIWADSDVDVTMCLTSLFYSDTSDLTPDDKARYERNMSSAGYSFVQFKDEVLAWLTKNFGAGVKAGKKAIFIPGNGNRRDADVLVCVEHRNYFSYRYDGARDFAEGICFWTTDGRKIVNYPKQHMENCTAKHQATGYRFKPNIRVLKNMRNSMIEKNVLADGVAPSYFLEGMLWNVPTNHFQNRYQDTFLNYMAWLDGCEGEKLVCANERYYLLRDNSPVCWNTANFNTFRAAARRFWNMH